MLAKIKNYFLLLRPLQWTKNTLVFATLIFNGDFLKINLLLKTILGFILFCLISGCIYIINDLRDYEKDKHHPVKCKRPIAAGIVGTSQAIILLFFLLTICLILSYIYFSALFFLTILLFFFLNLIYTFIVKNIEVLELIFVSFGYVLRTFSGITIVTTNISYWILVCSGLIALFIILIKRKQEYLLASQNNDFSFRPVLQNYTLPYLEQLINISAAATILSYCLYTFTSHKGQQIPGLVLTIPFVIFGIFRYLYLANNKNFGGEPETAIFKDISLLICILMWTVLCGFLILLKGRM